MPSTPSRATAERSLSLCRRFYRRHGCGDARCSARRRPPPNDGGGRHGRTRARRRSAVRSIFFVRSRATCGSLCLTSSLSHGGTDAFVTPAGPVLRPNNERRASRACRFRAGGWKGDNDPLDIVEAHHLPSPSRRRRRPHSVVRTRVAEEVDATAHKYHSPLARRQIRVTASRRRRLLCCCCCFQDRLEVVCERRHRRREGARRARDDR